MTEHNDYMDEVNRIAGAAYVRRELEENPMLNPGLFADETDGLLSGHWDDDWLGSTCPDAHSAERKALRALEQAHPEITGSGINAFWTYQETVFALALALYSAGLRHGAAYENLRRSVVGEIKACGSCWGAGVDKQGATCERCGGTGTVAHRP